MSVETFIESKDGPPVGLLETHVELFLKRLRAAGYAERTLSKKRTITESFVRWIKREGSVVTDLEESHLAAFVNRSPERQIIRINFELAGLRPFLKHLRQEAVVPEPAPVIDLSPGAELQQRYVRYLREERGLTENSILVYSRYIHDFLATSVAGSATPGELEAVAIQEFLLNRVRNRSNEYSRLLATALRSFLRFLFVRSETMIDLSVSIPTVKTWRQAAVPALFTPEEVERVVSAPDRSTPGGCRDYAILLLLARLGLRAGEVVMLELDDVHWRTAEIIIRSKGRVTDSVPLLSDIGDAMAQYLLNYRGSSDSRRVFLRIQAPRVGLTGPAAVGHIVRRALVKAEIRPTRRGAAHIFRHSLATTMFRHGASMEEIAEVLRHRSQNTTAIYAKVDFEALRSVARPWPGTGETL